MFVTLIFSLSRKICETWLQGSGCWLDVVLLCTRKFWQPYLAHAGFISVAQYICWCLIKHNSFSHAECKNEAKLSLCYICNLWKVSFRLFGLFVPVILSYSGTKLTARDTLTLLPLPKKPEVKEILVKLIGPTLVEPNYLTFQFWVSLFQNFISIGNWRRCRFGTAPRDGCARRDSQFSRFFGSTFLLSEFLKYFWASACLFFFFP